MACSFPLSLLLSACNRKLVLFIRITVLNWSLLDYAHSSFPSPAQHIPPPKIPRWPQSKKRWRMLWKMIWTNIGGSFLEGETEAWRAQWLTQGNRTCGCPGSQATAFLIAPWLLCFMCPQPGLCIDMPSSPALSLEEVSLLWMTKFFREHFPSLKGFGRKLAVSWALKPVGTSWPYNYAWIHSSQSSQPFITGFGPKTEVPYPPGLTAPQVTSRYLFQTISLPKHQGLPHKDPHKVRRAQGQVQPWA